MEEKGAHGGGALERSSRDRVIARYTSCPGCQLVLLTNFSNKFFYAIDLKKPRH
jgi:hypothetical protein